MLALADGGGLDRLHRCHEQRHVGVPHAERREPVELLRQVEGQCGGRDDRVDDLHVP